MKRLLSRLASVVLAAVPLGGQQPAGQSQELTSLKGVVLKNRAPVSDEILRVRLPRPVEFKLKNGLTVLVLENHRTPTVLLDLVLPASTLSDPPELPGVAHATADMVRLGTTSRDARQIAETLAELGASIGTSAEYGSHSTHVTLSTLTENLDAALDVFADVLLNPSFPQDELDKWKARQVSFLQQARSQPGFLASERMYRILYEGDARSVTAPTPESVKKLTRQHLVDYYGEFYRPSNSFLGVAGDVSPKQIVAKLEKLLAAWKPGTGEELKLPIRGPIREKRIVLIDRPNSVQTHLMVANRAIDRLSPDYYACLVMNRVLGQGPAARLFRNIREDKGYTYGIGSSFTSLRHLHHFSASTSVRTEVTGPVLEELLKEFRDIRDRPIPPDELKSAKRAIVAGFALSLESTGNLLRQVLLQREYGFPADYWDRYPELLMKVSAADAQKAAIKYVPVDNVQVVAVGDASRIREVLKKFGALEEYSAEGEKTSASAGAR